MFLLGGWCIFNIRLGERNLAQSEDKAGKSTVNTAGHSQMLHLPTPLKLKKKKLHIKFARQYKNMPYIYILIDRYMAWLYNCKGGLWEFASVAATCDRNQVESVPFIFFNVCFSQRYVNSNVQWQRVPWILYKVIILQFSLLNDVVNWTV